MNLTLRLGAATLLLGQLVASGQMLAQNGMTSEVQAQPVAGDGNHGFDTLLGSWKYRLRRLQHPLTGSTSWVDLSGTGETYAIWNRRAQMDTFEADGPTGHIEGLTLRLFDPHAQQWRLYWANTKVGILDPAQVGEFKDGHGDFYTQDRINGKVILIRYDWSRMTSSSPHFEQSFSDDGGKTWEANWITDQERTGDAPSWDPGAQSDASAAGSPSQAWAAGIADSHDFDFDMGTWKIHMRRLLHPLTGSSEWTEMDGTTAVHNVWSGNGRANLATVEADGPTGHLELVALRLYDPEAHQWRISFATSDVGILSVPAIGEFRNGRGEFYDEELYHGRNILVRFRIWQVSADSVSSDQAFSDDGGKTWETNWVNSMTRVGIGGAK